MDKRSFLVLAGLFWVGMMVCDVPGQQINKKEEVEKKNKNKIDDDEREFRTFIDRTKKMLANHDCFQVNEQTYPIDIVKELTAKFSINNAAVFVVEADSIAATALTNGDINMFNNAIVYSRSGSESLVLIDKWLVNNLAIDELRGLLAHEMSHVCYKRENLQKELRLKRWYLGGSLVAASVLLGYSIYLETYFKKAQWAGVELKAVDVVKYVGAMAMAWGAMMSNTLFELWRERHEEKWADLKAVAITQSDALARALKKMRERDIELYPASMNKYEWYEKWFPWSLDHPALKKRASYIEEAARKFE